MKNVKHNDTPTIGKFQRKIQKGKRNGLIPCDHAVFDVLGSPVQKTSLA